MRRGALRYSLVYLPNKSLRGHLIDMDNGTGDTLLPVRLVCATFYVLSLHGFGCGCVCSCLSFMHVCLDLYVLVGLCMRVCVCFLFYAYVYEFVCMYLYICVLCMCICEHCPLINPLLTRSFLGLHSGKCLVFPTSRWNLVEKLLYPVTYLFLCIYVSSIMP